MTLKVITLAVLLFATINVQAIGPLAIGVIGTASEFVAMSRQITLNRIGSRGAQWLAKMLINNQTLW